MQAFFVKKNRLYPLLFRADDNLILGTLYPSFGKTTTLFFSFALFGGSGVASSVAPEFL